ncbi:Asp-tRNA(Asn)/Glu-tRNA(Gln) amidotransferase subunit GatA [Listeria booriae]|uniref:Glutamyl-tRNA(Gln) amidotransferase subunit A n=1 Tax=Listeria booriae TaxID=1552123 RepID=A0A7X1D9T8_9LIST|nr:Asp-tRNA(Asn)/Glu-tRNA(Gln) amidotransferase subunit GatA [Listeria booriae]MBC2178045.1 Asp-tRNA(Asn)/Glu-tRNA(Gln) amidotransferase subunit GatA [Listeria booriae]
MALFEHSVKELHEKLVKKEIAPYDLLKESFDRIDAVEDKVKSFITLNRDKALDIAEELGDAGIDPNNMLAGLPIGIKDNIVTKNLRTTAASKILENFDPIYDATVMQKLKAAQVINVGKVNLDEFAMGSSTENSYFHTTTNPWNLNKVPGGSSGGSAASVAAGEVLFSLGSDTGGSIRQPAAFCGVVGMKPTYGRVSRYGLIAFASSLDQIGPITRTVEDNAYLLEAISGVDPHDSTSIDQPVENFAEHLTGDIKGLRIGVPKEYIGEGVEPGVKEAVLKALKTLEDLGATWDEVSLPHSEYGVASYYILASSEASSNLARFDGVRYGYRSPNAHTLEELYKKTRAEGFGDEVKRRIMLGTFALSSGYYDAYYKKGQQARTLIKQDFANVFANYDVIIGPSAPTVAFDIGGLIHDPITMYLNDLLTIPINLAGLPAISVPCGLSEGMPVGLQVIGNYFDEKTIYRVAHAFEQATEFHKEKPSL